MNILNRIPTGAATAVATLCLFVGCSAQAPFQANESEALDPESPELSEDSSPISLPGQELLLNGGFETQERARGPLVRKQRGNRNRNNSAYSGNFRAVLNGKGQKNSEALTQTLTIPADASQVLLSFALRVSTSEASSSKKDKL